jgi:integrase
LPEEATEELPDSSSNRSDQQHWTLEQRQQLLDYTRQRAHDVIDEDGYSPAAIQAARDRAHVAMLYFAAVRGAEVLRHRRDSREGRQGLRWERVSLTDGAVELLGKGEQAWVKHPLPGPTTEYLEQLKRVQRPASDSWPVFATSHAPSNWSVAREALPEHDVDALVDEMGNIDAVLREFEVSSPSLTTDGARSRLLTQTENAGVDLDESADYLQPHGARRGMMGEMFKRERGEAQDLGRHKDMSTTEA